MSFAAQRGTACLILLVYAVLRIGVLDFDLENVDDGDADHDKHEDCDPLKRLLRLDLLVQVVDSFAQLVDRRVEMLLVDGLVVRRRVRRVHGLLSAVV